MPRLLEMSPPTPQTRRDRRSRGIGTLAAMKTLMKDIWALLTEQPKHDFLKVYKVMDIDKKGKDELIAELEERFEAANKAKNDAVVADFVGRAASLYTKGVMGFGFDPTNDEDNITQTSFYPQPWWDADDLADFIPSCMDVDREHTCHAFYLDVIRSSLYGVHRRLKMAIEPFKDTLPTAERSIGFTVLPDTASHESDVITKVLDAAASVLNDSDVVEYYKRMVTTRSRLKTTGEEEEGKKEEEDDDSVSSTASNPNDGTGAWRRADGDYVKYECPFCRNKVVYIKLDLYAGPTPVLDNRLILKKDRLYHRDEYALPSYLRGPKDEPDKKKPDGKKRRTMRDHHQKHHPGEIMPRAYAKKYEDPVGGLTTPARRKLKNKRAKQVRDERVMRRDSGNPTESDEEFFKREKANKKRQNEKEKAQWALKKQQQQEDDDM